ncbi:MAG: NapC/NirT family cytochrome c [Pseudomonadota bacterium]
MRRLWRWLTRPATSLSAAFLLLVGGVGGVVFWGGFNTAMEYTNTMEFCISCHEMESKAYAEYKGTIHYSNASGVRATCADCHVPKEWTDKFVRKVVATRELFHHFAGTLSTPEKYEANRLEMARRVWAQMEANDSQECRNCHTYEAMDFHAQAPDAAAEMRTAFAEGDTCISCHKGIAHEMPDMTVGFRSMYTALDGAGFGRATTLNAYRVKSLLPEPATTAEGIGRLMPFTEVTVVDREDDMLKIRVDGWQQDGNDRVIFWMRGQRIFGAALERSVTDQVVRHATEVDPATDLTWHRVSFEGWTDSASLNADRQELHDLGKELYQSSCGTCHALVATDSQLANQWPGVLRAKRRFTSLDDDQYFFLQAYLQQHARDTAGKGHGS